MQHLRDENGIKIFGKKLREIRQMRNISQQELAYKAEIEIMQVSRIECGKINTSLSQILNIARALEINPKTFFE